MLSELGIPNRFAQLKNHQANPVERFHQTLYALVKSLQQEWETRLISGIRNVVMLYNDSIHSSLGVTPNQLRFGYDIRDKWSGPNVFLDTMGETMAIAGTMPTRRASSPWKAKTIHPPDKVALLPGRQLQGPLPRPRRPPVLQSE